MSQPRFEIRCLDFEGMQTPIGWAQAEGWNPGLDDHRSFYATDAQGFLGGWLEGRIIATISAVSYGGRFGFIGFYIVDPEFRGQGYGRKIWEAALERLQGQCLGLDGVVAQQDFYRRSGFELAHRNIRMQGSANSFPESGLAGLDEISATALYEYDRRHFGFERPQFLKAWLNQDHGLVRISLHGNAIQGYGVIRKCYAGYKIGPLFANDRSIAEDILQALISAIPAGETFYLDIPESNLHALRLCETYGMSPVFETARMYKGPAPRLPLDNIFGITSFELG